jgi:hypothetical protein
MAEIYEFTLIFESDKGHPLNFKYRISREDYGTFYSIVNNFFLDELDEEHIDEINKCHPELQNKTDTSYTLRDIFERDFIIDGVDKINATTYKIVWGT